MDDLSTRRIILIGGAGFVGHHLALGLKRLGAKVFVYDSLAVNNYYSVKRSEQESGRAELYLDIVRRRLHLMRSAGIPLIVEDARDYGKLSDTIADLDVDTVIHLAAVAHAGKSNKDPFSTFDHSLRTLENALDTARSPNLNIRHFVYLSSSMVYGDFAGGQVTEESNCEPIGIYGALKFAGEKLVIAYNQVFDLPYTIIRPSALYGPRCISRRVGQVFIENALQGLTVSMHGDGSDRLDFTYIDDLVSGIVQVLRREQAKNEIFNLTYGEARTIRELADVLADYFPDSRIKSLPRDRLMPLRGTLNVEKAKRIIGYQPQFPLEKGMVKYIEWYQSIWNTVAADSAQLVPQGA